MKWVYVAMVGVGLFVLTPGAGLGQEPKIDQGNARRVIEGYVAAALAGKVEDAATLAQPGQSPERKERIEEFKPLVNLKTLKITKVLVSEKSNRAMAISEEVQITRKQPNGQDKGRLTFLLLRDKDKWRVMDVDFRTEEVAKEQETKFAKRYADAKEVKGN